ncbi:MAG: prepilin peptidase [Deltaproteobacteria bacterium]|nr:prepilin peptidase [Deltaproteobacteria bacterium]
MIFVLAHLLNIFSFVFGAVVGSFLNVCIYRIPAGSSIATPSSHCPHCKKPIRFYDNIPILSYVVLRGRCRTCNEKIPIIYPAVEALTALISLSLFLKYGPSLQYLIAFLFASALIVITFIDLEHQIIPDVISLPGIPLFAIAAVLVMDITLWESLIGVLIGGGVLFAIAFGYELITKREGMGGGDIKLLAMIGGFFGWKSLIFILLVSSFVGAIIGISVILFKGQDMKYAIPFGPFLSIAAVAYIFWGTHFMNFLLYR